LQVRQRNYSVELWFWNGLPTNVRGTTGWLLSSGEATSVGIGGISGARGKLILVSDRMKPMSGKTVISDKTWNYVVLVREGSKVNVYLNGQETAEISASLPTSEDIRSDRLYIGGRPDPTDSFEGKIDEVAVYDRTLSPLEISDHYRLSGLSNK
jgi:Concanavalin A-like lectin/glucanases superfamily